MLLSHAIDPASAAVSFSQVLVVEDSLAMQERLAQILRGCGMPACGLHCAADVASARRLMGQHSFSLALVDIGLPDGSGVDLIADLHSSHPLLQCVVVSAWGAPDTIFAALRAGAVGYLLKERDDAELAHALRSMERGGAPIDPFVAKRILQWIGVGSAESSSALPSEATQPAALQPQPAPDQPHTQPLSAREQDILRRVAQGLSNSDIADALSLSKLTVESHTRNIYRKLAVSSRTAAVAHARQRGWLQ